MLRRHFLSSGLALPLLASVAQPSAQPFRLLFGGDTDFAESYSFSSNGRRTTAVRKYGYGHSLAMLAPILRRANHTVLNLETVFTQPREIDAPNKEYRHWSNGRQACRQLRRHGVDAVNLANNHTLDYGLEGLEDTLEDLERYDIDAFGGGLSEDDAALPHIVTVSHPNGTSRRVAIFGMFEYRRSYDRRHRFYADKDQGGAHRLDTDRFRQQVRRYRRDDPSLFVIAFPHWGSNYSWRSPEQEETGRVLIDAGADMVIGHHGHCLQEVEHYRDKWILYGIGNFMFNSPGRYAQGDETLPYSLAAELVFGDDSAAYPDIHLYPIQSDNRQTRYQPRLTTASQSRTVFEALQTRASNASRERMSLDRDSIGHFLRLAPATSVR